MSDAAETEARVRLSLNRIVTGDVPVTFGGGAEHVQLIKDWITKEVAEHTWSHFAFAIANDARADLVQLGGGPAIEVPTGAVPAICRLLIVHERNGITDVALTPAMDLFPFPPSGDERAAERRARLVEPWMNASQFAIQATLRPVWDDVKGQISIERRNLRTRITIALDASGWSALDGTERGRRLERTLGVARRLSLLTRMPNNGAVELALLDDKGSGRGAPAADAATTFQQEVAALVWEIEPR